MVGICGVLGDRQHDIKSLAETIEWRDDEESAGYREDTVQVRLSVHRETDAEQPATVRTGDEERLCWIWGDVIGVEDSTGYTPRRDQSTCDAAYCADLLEERGLSFVDGLNSEFAGLVVNRDRDEATLFTDRLGARPVYLTEALDGRVLFSTHPNTILAHPEFRPAVDDELMSEFLKFERAFGICTPFEDVYQLHPGSKLTVDLESGETSLERYWQPHYRPTEKPYDAFVEEFSSIMQRCVEERRRPEDDEGIFISGGSDSRLLLSLFEDRDVTGYHLNDAMNDEAKTAYKVCEMLGVEFRFLRRDQEYLTNVLERVGDFQIFSSFFDQAHFTGFEDELTDEIDAVFAGHTADTVLEGFYMPTRDLDVPGLGWTVPVPVLDQITGVDEYAEHITCDYQYHRGPSVNSQPKCVTLETDPVAVLREHMSESGGAIDHHGVRYPSLESLVHTGGFYPITNNKAYLMYYSANQMLPTHYPYLDNRVIEFSLSVPHRHHVRRSVVNRAVAKRNRDLAEIPKAGIGLPLTYPRTVYSAARLWRSFKSKLGTESGSGGGSWSDPDRIVRETDIVEEHLLTTENEKRCPDILDWETLEELYRAHLEGANEYFELFGALSLCHSYPVANDLIRDEDG
ncbi:asparagine synthase-related protein [Halopiger aswanensis]|uniref:Putative asparagine synthetase [glutamine-hydrolyzing] n=1 Tax=Halopiger aswanensis TaxID=148449 RepID=A0A419WRH8_9EURY|nr:asparagine synthase-related protein [Halopiger aswanensis]RKD98070.1 asparagine synthase (glutamine-hydrolysing) [Halopiger aswanensis]